MTIFLICDNHSEEAIEIPVNSPGSRQDSPCNDDRRCCRDCEWNPIHKASKGIQREKGFLYFIGKDGYVWADPMKHNTTGVKHKVGTIQITVEERKCIGHHFVERYIEKKKEV